MEQLGVALSESLYRSLLEVNNLAFDRVEVRVVGVVNPSVEIETPVGGRSVR